MIGKKCGHLTVIAESDKLHGERAWLCHCNCTRYKVIRGSNLSGGVTRSCGCRHGENLTGNRYGMLTVLCPTKPRIGTRRLTWDCECSCLNETKRTIQATAANLKAGRVASCGCRRGKGAAKQNADQMVERFDTERLMAYSAGAQRADKLASTLQGLKAERREHIRYIDFGLHRAETAQATEQRLEAKHQEIAELDDMIAQVESDIKAETISKALDTEAVTSDADAQQTMTTTTRKLQPSQKLDPRTLDKFWGDDVPQLLNEEDK